MFNCEVCKKEADTLLVIQVGKMKFLVCPKCQKKIKKLFKSI